MYSKSFRILKTLGKTMYIFGYVFVNLRGDKAMKEMLANSVVLLVNSCHHKQNTFHLGGISV